MNILYLTVYDTVFNILFLNKKPTPPLYRLQRIISLSSMPFKINFDVFHAVPLNGSVIKKTRKHKLHQFPVASNTILN